MIPINNNTEDTKTILYINEEAIKEFQELYLQQYGQKLTNEEALELGARLIGFVKAVYGDNLPKLKDIDMSTNKENN